MSNLASYIAEIGATGHWRLGESLKTKAVDQIGSNDLAWDATPQPVAGMVGGDADGAQDLGVTAKCAIGSVYAYANNFSLTAMIRITSLSQLGIIAYCGDYLTNGWALSVQNGSGGAGRELHIIVSTGTNQAVTVSRPLYLDANYLVTAIRRAGVWEMWLNDIKLGENASWAPYTPTTRFVIGDRTTGAGAGFVGHIDEVAIYDMPLTAAQILHLTKLMFAQGPAMPDVTVGDNGAGKDTFALSASAAGTFPVAGYGLWESYTGGTDEDFDFTKAAVQTLGTSGTFGARTAVAGKFYAIRAFDDRDEPNYSPARIVASVAVPVPTEVTMAAILALLSDTVTVNVVSSSPVATGGQITEPIVIGDDYLDVHQRAFGWTVQALPEVDVGDASCFFGAENSNGDSFVVEGTVSAGAEEGTWDLSFDLARTDTENLPEGDYKWSVEVRDAADKEITRVRNADFNYRVKLVAKQT